MLESVQGIRLLYVAASWLVSGAENQAEIEQVKQAALDAGVATEKHSSDEPPNSSRRAPRRSGACGRPSAKA